MDPQKKTSETAVHRLKQLANSKRKAMRWTISARIRQDIKFHKSTELKNAFRWEIKKWWRVKVAQRP